MANTTHTHTRTPQSGRTCVHAAPGARQKNMAGPGDPVLACFCFDVLAQHLSVVAQRRAVQLQDVA
jgi:hypothetical protein